MVCRRIYRPHLINRFKSDIALASSAMAEGAHLVQLTIRLKFGAFSDGERKEIVEAFRHSELGQVRIDEAIVTNLGIGGPGGLPIEFDIWLTILEGNGCRSTHIGSR